MAKVTSLNILASKRCQERSLWCEIDASKNGRSQYLSFVLEQFRIIRSPTISEFSRVCGGMRTDSGDERR
jgi:hypothetical protein